jgi:hypothetical protein
MGVGSNENLGDYGKEQEATQEAAQKPGTEKVLEEREAGSTADGDSGEAPADTPDEPEGT